ncbi:MAG: polyphosphate kinase 1 [Oscillospiraceae bacterium]|jgi:polyphosphate kinase|nr:polyphosphate kinase 1 [Oscillospiraceae bacterium]
MSNWQIPVKPYLDNRELSWLKFNSRVLEEAADDTVPLFERLKFVSIFCSNLDEFFMIRVGSLNDQNLVAPDKRDNKTGLTADEQLKLISEAVTELTAEKHRVYREIRAKLTEIGVAEHVKTKDFTDEDKEFLKDYFVKEIQPFLDPSIIDRRHPVQFLKNQEIYAIAVLLPKDATDDTRLSGILPISANNLLKRVVFLPQDGDMLRFILVESVILYFADLVFENYTVIEKNIFRLTRSADIDANEAYFEHDIDFRDMMEVLIKKRRKLAPVRIEFGTYADSEAQKRIVENLTLKFPESFIFAEETPLDFSFVGELEDKLSGKEFLFPEKFPPCRSPLVKPNEPIMKQLDKHDILLSFPYDKFSQFIRLIEEAATDPGVTSIKITLYRIARDSKIVSALLTAAENGKDVTAIVELRARFDEENNIGWSKRLEDAGVRVMYGLSDLKVHSKLLLITKRTGNGITYYTQIGTGNYNERTSKLYTDLTIMTADRSIGTDASMVFNAIAVGTTVSGTTDLLVAPKGLKPRVIELIDTEIAHGTDGYIGLKLNGLTDLDIIEKLADASRHGVRVDLLVRGICCIVAGVKGETENVRVYSIVGRHLEHSRIYIFGRDANRRVYISSADFMTRNTEKRVEVAAPIKDPVLAERLYKSFTLMLRDNVKLREQRGGINKKRTPGKNPPLETQVYFHRKAANLEQSASASPSGMIGTIANIIKSVIYKN